MKTLRRFRWVVLTVLLAHGGAHAAGSFTMTLLGPPDPTAYDRFAHAIASRGDRLVVGAPGFNGASALPGRVLVMDVLGKVDFVIENPTPAAGDEFGVSVALVGSNVLVGAPFDDTQGTDVGAAYLFDGATGALLQTFLPPGSQVGRQCGRRVAALAGNALVQCEGAYLFDVTTGVVVRHFTTPSGIHNPGFGTFDDDVILGDNDNAYRLDGATGALVTTYPNPEPGGSHPGEVAQHGTSLLVGRGFPHTPERVYVFDGDSGTLLHTIVGDSFGTPYSERFGQAVASLGDTVVVGAALSLYRFDGATYERLDRFFSEDTSRTAVASELGTVFGTSYAARAYDPSVNDGRGRLFLFDRCGNGIRSGGEQCDDGNVAGGDGCSPACHLELCPPTPDTGPCRHLTPGAKSILKLQSRRRGPWGTNTDQLVWRWKGQETSFADLGDPVATASYQLCVYDDVFGSPDLVMDPLALAGDGWTTNGSSMVRYRDKSRLPSGIEEIQLRAGADGRAKVSVTARGFRLGLPAPLQDHGPLPLGPGLAVVLRNTETGACWSAGFTNVKNTKGKVKARSVGS